MPIIGIEIWVAGKTKSLKS